MKSPFATLQQTETPSSLTGTVLHLGRFSIIFKLGHGEWLLPDGQVSLRSVNFAARRLLKLPDLLPGRHRSFQHNQIPIQPTIESAIKPSRNHPATPPKRPSHKPLPTPWPLAVGQATRSESRPTQADIDEVQRLGEEIDAMSERLRKRLTPERLEELEELERAEREQARQRAERDERRRAAAAKLDRAVTTLMWIGFPILLLFTLGFAWIGIWYGVLEIIHFPRDRISIAVNRGAELLIARPRLTRTLTVTRPLDQLSAITAEVRRLGSLRRGGSHAYHNL